MISEKEIGFMSAGLDELLGTLSTELSESTECVVDGDSVKSIEVVEKNNDGESDSKDVNVVDNNRCLICDRDDSSGLVYHAGESVGKNKRFRKSKKSGDTENRVRKGNRGSSKGSGGNSGMESRENRESRESRESREGNANNIRRKLERNVNRLENPNSSMVPVRAATGLPVAIATSKSFIDVDFKDETFKELLSEFGKDVNSMMPVVNWVGDTDMLLKYIVDTQSNCRVTLPLRSLGIDISMFEYINSENGFYIVGDQKYELVHIGEDYYLSCATAIINDEEVKAVLREMTSSLIQYGRYVLNRCCYRIYEGKSVLDPEDAETTVRSNEGRHLIYTLRLNTFELRLICASAQTYEGITIRESENDSGQSCIVFEFSEGMDGSEDMAGE